MDRWKLKELKQMELGGNKNAQVFYEENFMFKDGKPDHEAPLHSRYKMELAAKAEAAIREQLQSQGKWPRQVGMRLSLSSSYSGRASKESTCTASASCSRKQHRNRRPANELVLGCDSIAK